MSEFFWLILRLRLRSILRSPFIPFTLRYRTLVAHLNRDGVNFWEILTHHRSNTMISSARQDRVVIKAMNHCGIISDSDMEEYWDNPEFFDHE